MALSSDGGRRRRGVDARRLPRLRLKWLSEWQTELVRSALTSNLLLVGEGQRTRRTTTSSTFAQLCGRKRVIPSRPRVWSALPSPSTTRSIASRRSTRTRPTPTRAAASRASRRARREALLGPGDVLHIPVQVHHIENLDHGCVSLNFWFKTGAGAAAAPPPTPPSPTPSTSRCVGTSRSWSRRRSAPPPRGRRSRPREDARPAARRRGDARGGAAGVRSRRGDDGRLRELVEGGSHEGMGRVDVCVQRACVAREQRDDVDPRAARGPKARELHDLVAPASRTSTSARWCCAVVLQPRCVPRERDSPLEGPTDSAR